MAEILYTDLQIDQYLFLTNFSDVLKAGKNSFTVNPTKYVHQNSTFVISAFDAQNNQLPGGEIRPINAQYSEETNSGKFYYINVFENSANGIGRIEIKFTGIEVREYSTGSIAYYKDEAYEVPPNTRLPLTRMPTSAPLPKTEILAIKNVLIDTTKRTDSEVRFFATPYVRVKPEIYTSPIYPTGSYSLALGNFSAVAVNPKHNGQGDYNYQFDTAIYQIYWKSGNKFSASMEGESIRLKNPLVSNFKFNQYEEPFQGTLNTDFIAKVSKVVNDTSLLIDVPFSTVSDLIGRINEDSQYAKNNLTELKDIKVDNNPENQVVYHKKNFYTLSIDSGEFEIFYKNINPHLPTVNTSGSSNYRSVINIECNNIRTLCGNLESYKIYGRSLNTPEDRTLLTQGYIHPDQAIVSTNFNNGVYNYPSYFYSQEYVNRHWFINGNCTFLHNNTVLIDGAYIGHNDNSSLTDYVIFKDDTDIASNDSQYATYNLHTSSYWYATSDAFINQTAYPTASYSGIVNIPNIFTYTGSQENLISGVAHDCNPIKFRENTLYKFSMRVKAGPDNSSGAKLYVYAVSGQNKVIVGYIDSAYNFGANELYENTFFSKEEKYGTILLVPVQGYWHISNITIAPHQAQDYSIDSFAIKVPLLIHIPNEYYEIEMELYDSNQRLAYGTNSYSFVYNKRFLPLKKRIFIDPVGLTTSCI